MQGFFLLLMFAHMNGHYSASSCVGGSSAYGEADHITSEAWDFISQSLGFKLLLRSLGLTWTLFSFLLPQGPPFSDIGQ